MERDGTLLKPFVYWGQNKQSVFFKIEIAELDGEPQIEITDKTVKFLAHGLGVSGKHKFGFKLDLYKPINASQSCHKVLGRIVEIKCKKKEENEKWPRVTEQAVKRSWLKTDFDRFTFDSSDESSVDEENLINEAKRSPETMKLMEEFGRGEDIESDWYYSVRQVLKVIYLTMYNIFQFIGFTYIFCNIIIHLIKRTSGSQNNAFLLVGYQMMICQSVAVMEIFHSSLGWVKSSIGATILQIFGRGFILFGIIYPEPRLHTKEVVWFLFLAWSSVELIRYPYYMFATLKKEFGLLTWLRYTVWIPLYPFGFILEGLVMLIALPMYEDTQMYNLTLPNEFNLSFDFPTILKLYMLLCLPGMYILMQRMYEQRKRKLNVAIKKGQQHSKSKKHL